MENILRGKKAKSEVIKGMEILANVIGDTLGPRGRNVIIDSGIDYPVITNDGASIAKEMFLTSPFKDIGMRVLKEASLKTNELMGDGTTTAIVLSESILRYGKKYLSKGKNVSLLKDELDKIYIDICRYVDQISKKDISSKDIKNLAYVSSGNIKNANILKEIYEKGDIHSCFIEDTKAEETSYEILDGMYIDGGYISEYLNTSSGFKNILNPYIILYDGKLESIRNMVNVLEEIKSGKGSVVIIAKDFSKEARNSIIYNYMNNILDITAIKMPEYFDMTKDFFKDLSLNIGTNIFTNENEFLDLSIEDLVKVKNVKVSKSKTYIIPEKDKKENIEKILFEKKKIQDLIKSEKDKSKKERLKKRLSIYESKISNIKIGAQTEAERKNMKLKLEDAIATCISSLEGGALEGGGLAFLKISKFLECEKAKLKLNKKQMSKELYKIKKDAYNILIESLKVPFNKIVLNSGKNPKKIYKEIRKKDFNIGFNAEDFSFASMYDAGIIDSKLGQLTALKTALSVSLMVLSMSSVIYKDLDYDIE